MVWLIIPYMAYTSRMCGGAPPALRWGLEQWIYAIPYLYFGLPAYVCAVLGKRTGHGRGMSLNEPMKPDSKPERVEAVILWLQPYMPVYWYKCLILALTGAVEVMGAVVVCLIFGQWLAALVMAVAGLSKPVAYMIGWAVYPAGHGRGIPQLNEATQIGEALYGAFIGLAVVLVWLL